MQQRGIREEAIELLLDYGRERHVHNGGARSSSRQGGTPAPAKANRLSRARWITFAAPTPSWIGRVLSR